MAHVSVDIDYKGDSAQFQHLIKNNKGIKDLVQPNQANIQFSMKLRSYKNTSDFQAQKAFQVPGLKKFDAKTNMKMIKSDVMRGHKDFKYTYNDKFKEKNVGAIDY